MPKACEHGLSLSLSECFTCASPKHGQHQQAADELTRLRAEVEALRADAGRLAFIYGPATTDSPALYELELRVFNEDWPTLDEIRAAIDAAMKETKK